MKKQLFILSLIALCFSSCSTMNMDRVVSAGGKALQAATLTDAQIIEYTKQFINESDGSHTIVTGNDPYAVRLNRIVKNINNVDGINIKAYKTTEVNAFACADGSVRVYTGLMDIMSDEEILGVIGHEIGHVKNKDTRDAFRNALLNSAMRDAVSSTSTTVAALTDSQLGDLGESFLSARYSQKQEYAADSFGYEFLKGHSINPWAMALSFEKLAAMEAKAGTVKSDAIQQLFATHPDLAARTKVMVERATTDGFKRPVKK